MKGNYSEFSVEWYRLVGASLCVQLGIMIIADALTSFVWALKNFCVRCCDRSCTLDARRTKKRTQQDYEEINYGPEIEMHEKYATMLVVALLAFAYGPGLPIMYLLAAVYFFVNYWTDKIMIFYNHRKPLYFDEMLALQSTKWLKVGVVLHFLVGLMMYSNSKILPVGEISTA